jgi:hypothetical protein
MDRNIFLKAAKGKCRSVPGYCAFRNSGPVCTPEPLAPGELVIEPPVAPFWKVIILQVAVQVSPAFLPQLTELSPVDVVEQVPTTSVIPDMHAQTYFPEIPCFCIAAA